MNSDDTKKANELSARLKATLGSSARKVVAPPKEEKKDLSFIKKLTGIKQPPKPKENNLVRDYVAKNKEKPHTDSPEEIVGKVNASSKKIRAEVIEGLPTPSEVVEAIKNLKGNERIDISHLRNGENLARIAQGGVKMNDQRWHGGGDTVTAGTNVTITTNANGQKVISSTGGGTPGGANTSVQYNNAGSFGGFGTYDGTYLVLPNGQAFKGQYTNVLGSAFINPDGSAVFGGGVLIITNAGVLTAANFSGTSSGTNTGDQNLTPYALLASPAFTGNPTAPTPSATDNDTSIATTAFVQTGIKNAITVVANGATGILLTGAAYKKTFGSNLSTGDNDLYTCPSNKRALVMGVNVYNQSAGNILWYMELKTTLSAYFRLTATTTTATISANSATSPNFILEAGESISVNVATNNGLNIWVDVIEYDSTNALFTKYVINPASGDNTIYTVATSKTGKVCGFEGSSLAPTIKVVNSSGGSFNYSGFIVPNGGSSGNTNKFLPPTNVNNLNVGTLATQYGPFAAGDFLVVNITATGTSSIIYATILETPA